MEASSSGEQRSSTNEVHENSLGAADTSVGPPVGDAAAAAAEGREGGGRGGAMSTTDGTASVQPRQAATDELQSSAASTWTKEDQTMAEASPAKPETQSTEGEHSLSTTVPPAVSTTEAQDTAAATAAVNEKDEQATASQERAAETSAAAEAASAAVATAAAAAPTAQLATAASKPSPSSSSSAPAQGATGSAEANAFRPLNVRDALQYLDRVKQQFSTEYEVYDKFLTIMKDFKTQNIDTPGVIDRVSTLFRGHPSLIQGFNTFLPPGYRIECSVSTTDGYGGSNIITVTTPMGVTTRTQDVNGTEAREFAKMQPGSVNRSSSSSSSTAQLPKQTDPRSGVSTIDNTPHSTPGGPSGSKSSSAARPRLPSPPGPIPPFNPKRAQARRAQLAAQQQAQAQISAQTGASLYGQSPYGSPSQHGHLDDDEQRSQFGGPTNKAAIEASDAAGTLTNHAAASVSSTGQPGGPPVMEFNHAINYVNKIKNRFTKDPDTYKTFLEILQTYQKETRPIQEVYQQVTALFHSAPDLLDEFKAFLPDTSDPSASALFGAGGLSAGPSAGTSGSTKQRRTGESSRGGNAFGGGSSSSRAGTGAGGKNADGAPEKKKRAAPGTSDRAKSKRSKTAHAANDGSGSSVQGGLGNAKGGADREAGLNGAPGQPTSMMAVNQPYGAPPPGFPGAPRMQSAYDAYLANHRTPALVQLEEFGFFDRVKKYLDDRAAYTEFLKLLNLFTQEIIDARTLLEMALPFIGNSVELFVQMKELVGWDTVKDGRVKGEEWVIDNEPVLDRPRVELHLLKTFGPSYRKLPDSEIDLACSGREPLDWSVLNDDWVAYATWASEGSGMHRKNPYEDALYNSEQERHWYSFQIDSLNRTIAHFEPIAARIVQMNAEERANFRLGEDLGGPGPGIYTRIIRKIWGKDTGWDIIEALEENPAVAVPVVLSRLKQKDEEWKRAEREWNKVWREVDAKNYYRALDHQALTFKVVDKKNTMTSKTLTSEIETLKRDRQTKRVDLEPAGSALRPRHQFEFGFSDKEVLFDALKLTFGYLDRDQSGFSAPERVRVEAFLRLFVPLMFNISNSEMERNLAATEEFVQEQEREDDADNDSDTDMAASDADTNATGDGEANGASGSAASKRVGGFGGRRNGVANLRKRLLTHATSVAAKNKGAVASRPQSPAPGEAVEVASTNGVSPSSTGVLGEQTWIQLAADEGLALDEPLAERRFNCFANSTFYCLVRTLQVLYHRLLEFKTEVNALASKPWQPRLSSVAVHVGLANPIPIIDTKEGADGGSAPDEAEPTSANPASQYYEYALDLMEKMFDGDIEPAQLEDVLRYMVGIKAYPLFTVDKVCATIIKHIHTINGDSRCQDLVSLLEKDRLREQVTPRQQIAYRMEAESIIGFDEPLYRLEWIPEAKALTVQLLGNEDLTLDEAYGDESRMHASWVASYSLTSATENVGCPVTAPFLKRNRTLSANEDPQEFDLNASLEAKVVGQTYALQFVANTEDYLYRKRSASASSASSSAAAEEDPAAVKIEPVTSRRKRRFEHWLESRRSAEASAPSTDGGDEGKDVDMADV